MRILFAILILIIFFGFIYFSVGFFMPVQPGSQETVDFLIQRGEGAKEISIKLKNDGLIRWSSIFRIYVLVRQEQKNLKAGSYSLSKSMSLAEIAEKFIGGDIIKNEITIIEGWNLRDIGWHFENRGMFMAEELFEIAGFPASAYDSEGDFPLPKDFSGEFVFLEDKPKDIGLEGYLFPDTYEFFSESNLEEIVEKILVNFEQKLTLELRWEIETQGKTIFEIITAASLLEKEVRTLEDKKIVSGILWERLKLGVPLQMDATITYITGKRSVKVLKEETQIDSLYNTYKYKGLPLGPIANPGLESIEAAIYPEESDYFYYLSTPEGETIFSKTLEEHNQAKVKYLK